MGTVDTQYDPKNVTSVFGDTADRANPHHGEDFAATLGDAVPSLSTGKVIKAGFDSELGNYVVVASNTKPNVDVWYGHLADFAVKEGDAVSRGTKLGTVGLTGDTTGPHIHVGTSIDGQFYDPEQFRTLFKAVSVLGNTDIISITGDILDKVPGVSAVTGVVNGTGDLIKSVGKLTNWLGKSGHWWAIGFTAGGLMIMGLGVVIYLADSESARNVAMGAAKTAEIV